MLKTPCRSFAAVQDSRLFGSPEFTAQFPNRADRIKVAAEIWKKSSAYSKEMGLSFTRMQSSF
jgi:hypothetical protein